jgi:hypothetical protein
MNLNIEYRELKTEFKQKLRWFEEEFDLIFDSTTHTYSKDDQKLAYKLINKLTDTINEYNDTNLISLLVSTLSAIEKKYPEFF